MRKKCGPLFICVILGALAGCGQAPYFWSSPEEKINAAFPVSDSVQSAKTGLFKDAATATVADVEVQMALRMKLRALNCAKGYSPTLFTSASTIRKVLESNSCFAETDNEIRKWLGLKRAGLLLSKTALREAPKTPPNFLVGDAFISGAKFAESAAVAILETQQSMSIVDFESTKPIFREPRSSAIGAISPNGRLFVSADSNGDLLKIRDVETGGVLTEIPMVRAFQFKWLDARTAVYVSRDTSKTYILDFTSAREIQVQGIANGFDQAVKVAGSEDQYVLLGQGGISKIQLIRAQMEPEVRLIAEKPMPGLSCGSNASGMTSDGAYYVCTAPSFALINLATLDIESVSLEPFRVQTGLSAPDPDQVHVRGYIQPSQGEGVRQYMYSIRNRTLSPIDRGKGLSERFEHISSIRRLAVINQSKVEILGELPMLAPVSIEKFRADAQEVVNLRKMAAFEKQMAPQSAGSLAAGQLSAKPMVVNGPLVEISKEAQIEAVGVYQGNGSVSQSSGSRQTGYVEVRIRRSSKPIVLVLSSYEPVRWMLVSEAGARLAAVLVSGYHPSQVVGAGSAPIVMNGSKYAYKADSSEYRALNQAVYSVTGREIGLFQGRYDGGQFSVGAISRW